MCLSPHLYPQECDDHTTHHPRMACCITVNHLWTVVSKHPWSSYNMEEQLTIQRINNYLYAAINMTAENCDPLNLPTFPLLQNR
eukprot:1530509-Amphidinium_carterae.1